VAIRRICIGPGEVAGHFSRLRAGFHQTGVPPQPLVLGPNGSKLSKRDQYSSIADLRDAGIPAEAVRAYLDELGLPKHDVQLDLARIRRLAVEAIVVRLAAMRYLCSLGNSRQRTTSRSPSRKATPFARYRTSKVWVDGPTGSNCHSILTRLRPEIFTCPGPLPAAYQEPRPPPRPQPDAARGTDALLPGATGALPLVRIKWKPSIIPLRACNHG